MVATLVLVSWPVGGPSPVDRPPSDVRIEREQHSRLETKRGQEWPVARWRAGQSGRGISRGQDPLAAFDVPANSFPWGSRPITPGAYPDRSGRPSVRPCD